MKVTGIVLSAAVCAGVCLAEPEAPSAASPKGTAVFTGNWENIAANYRFPQWFQDAKFGIFIHWGVYSVPAFGNEWYPRNMYIKNSREWKHHREAFGDHAAFGYKDFIPKFTAEKFDADAWCALFKEAGARYVVPVAEHHDGFAMYASKRNPWNAAAMGPRKDIIGLLKAAADKQGLVFGVSSHRLENNWFYNNGQDKTGLNTVTPGAFKSDTQDISVGLYGLRLAKEQYGDPTCRDWLAHVREIIDTYQPRLLWFDWTVQQPSFRPTFNTFLAYYYNCARDWGVDVAVNTKAGYPNEVQVSDIERGKSDIMHQYPWQTDTSVGKKSWCYIEGEEQKTPGQIVRDLIDIVSKNGNLLLNIGPKADGTITPEQQAVLRAIGAWLTVNGDAVYGTRPWFRFGEGATKGTAGAFSDNAATAYTTADLRFTTRGNDLYVTFLEWGETALVKTLTPETVGAAKLLSVSLLGSDAKIAWEQTPEGLKLTFPPQKPCAFAYAFRLAFDQKPGAHLKSEAVNRPFKHH